MTTAAKQTIKAAAYLIAGVALMLTGAAPFIVLMSLIIIKG